MEESQAAGSGSRSQTMLAASILASALIVGGAVIYSSGAGGREGLAQVAGGSPTETRGEAESASPPTADDDVVLGEPDAPVTFIEWGDYQCPFCAKVFAEVEPKLREEYVRTGKVKMVYRDFAFLGPESETAALASQCAAEQGKFWAYHDRLFETEIADGRENNGNLTPDFMRSLASELGFDRGKFDTCLDSKKYQDEIAKDYADGVAAGVRGTPATFIGGTLISGAQGYPVFKAAIDEALAAKKG